MSNFILNLFNTRTKTKTSRKSSNPDDNDRNSKNDANDVDEMFSRKMSKSKSGRLKENKRKMQPVADCFPTTTTTNEIDKKSDNSVNQHDAVATAEEVIRELQELGSLENL